MIAKIWSGKFNSRTKDPDSTLRISRSIRSNQKYSLLFLIKSKLCLGLLVVIGIAQNATGVHSQTYQPSNRIPIADNTLGTKVSGSNSDFAVTGGLSRGQNLFHSFQDFSVPTNGIVTFANPVGNQSIITRVTGNLFSDINGKVDTNGANFFLINPNGIIFGNNVQLNVGKSFVSGTANGIDLVDLQGKVYTFSTRNISDTPLLTINPNVLLNVSRLNMGAIASTDIGIKNYGTLQTINDNQYIGLIGGNVTLDGSFGAGDIIARGGRVDLGGLNSVGTVSVGDRGLVFNGNNLGLSDVFILDGAWIDVRTSQSFPVDTLQSGSAFYGTNKVLGTVDTSFNNVSSRGSNVNINTNNLKLLSNPDFTNIQSSIKTSGGDININAAGKLSLNHGEISSDNTLDNPGSTGNINISAQTIAINDRSAIFSYTQGSNNAGDVNIKSTGDVFLLGSNTFNPPSADTIEFNGRGGVAKAFFLNSSSIASRTFGRGNSGKITIDTQGSLVLSNEGLVTSETATTEGISILSRNPTADSTGNSQGISISARNVYLENHSVIDASSGGQGNAGNISIKTTGDVKLVGYDTFSDSDTFSIYSGQTTYSGSRISSSGGGSTGKVSIEANGKLSLLNDSKVSSQPGSGNSQGIDISARELEMRNRSTIKTDSVGTGVPGDIKIQTTGNITIVNFQNPNTRTDIGQFIHTISSNTASTGASGKILIETKGTLSISNSADISSSVIGINDINTGSSQGIKISANQLNLNNRGYIFTDTNGNGGAGDVEITTVNALNLNNDSLILSGNRPYGNSLKGQSGNIAINSRQINIKNGSGIGTESISLTGGNIALTARDRILLQSNSDISTNSESNEKIGDGGNITINSPLIIATSGDNNITANASAGSGGKVNITSQGLFGIQFRPKGQDSQLTNDITASSTFGQNGTVSINTPGTDPGKDANQLPAVPTDASNQISQTCSPSNRDSKFAVTGRGGLPKNAYSLLTSDAVWQDPRGVGNQPIAVNTENQPIKKITPAIGWVFDGKGRVALVAAESPGQQTGTRVVCPNGSRK
jgi:filamentous hemagglutinin family protein